MSNLNIDYGSILNLIREEMELTRRSDERFSEFKLVVEDERLLAKSKDRSPDTMYIQVKFGAASTNFGQAVLPLSMEVIGINQDVQLTQELLSIFVNTYNRLSVGDIMQFFLTPVVSQNNIPIYEGYRSLFIVSATFVISNKFITINELKYKTGDDEYETVEVIGYNDSVEAALNPQPYPDGKGRTKSYGSYQTFAFSITTYPDSNKQLIKDLWAWKYDFSKSHANDTFIFSCTFKNTTTSFTDKEFKCKSVDSVEKIGEQPLITITFTL